MRDIGRSVGLSSTGSTSYQLGKLEQVGVIRRGKGRIALLVSICTPLLPVS